MKKTFSSLQTLYLIEESASEVSIQNKCEILVRFREDGSYYGRDYPARAMYFSQEDGVKEIQRRVFEAIRPGLEEEDGRYTYYLAFFWHFCFIF